MGLSLGPIEYRVVRLMQTHTHGKTLLLFVPYWRFPRAQLKDFSPADLMYYEDRVKNIWEWPIEAHIRRLVILWFTSAAHQGARGSGRSCVRECTYQWLTR